MLLHGLFYVSLSFLAIFSANATDLNASTSNAPTPSKKIAITFDDLPYAGIQAANVDGMRSVNEKIISIIKNYHIPAIGFVNEKLLLAFGPDKVDEVTAIIKLWLEAGLDLGNHTYSHLLLYTTPLAVYEQDVIKGEPVTSKLLNDNHMKMRYFRHPYLSTGPTLEIKRAFETFLKERGYTIAPVTIENEDFKFNLAYAKAKNANDIQAMQRIGKEYLEMTEKKIEFYENFSQRLFNRQINQVMLLHDSPLNADYFEDIVKLIQKRGYEFISLEEALKDEVYSLPDNSVGESDTWLTRWAYTKGENIDWDKYPTYKGDEKYSP